MKNVKMVKLENVVDPSARFTDGDWIESKDQDPNGDVRLIQLADIGDGFYIDKSARFLTQKKAFELRCTFLNKGDLLIARMPDPLGRACIFPGDKKKCVTVVDVCILRPNLDLVDSRWLMHKINENGFRRQIDSYSTGTTRTRISRTNLNKIEIPLPSLPEQKRIAEILDGADAARRKRRENLSLYDDLIRSLFLKTFGDPVSNPLGWDIESLTKFGSFKNGLNFGRGESGEQVRYLGVGDFKKRSRITDIESLSFIDLNALPSEEYFLRNGDLVFVRSNGNKQLVGRCISIYPDDEKVTFSGFCIRYRIEAKGIDPTFLVHLFRISSFKSKMLERGQGANIQNINQKILTALEIPAPSITLQNQFAEQVEEINAQKAREQALYDHHDDLFNALLQRAFKGEL